MDFEMRKRYFALQLELECTRIEDGRTLVPFLCANPDPPARVVIAKFGERCEIFVRNDIPATTRSDMLALDARAWFTHPERLMALFGDIEAPPTRFLAYAFAEPVALDGEAIPTRPVPNSSGFSSFGIAIGGTVVSTCSSVRENARSGEAWVFTDERYRQRGYARQAVLAWARHLQAAGKVPFYSHLQDNLASRRLAASLGLPPFVDALAIP